MNERQELREFITEHIKYVTELKLPKGGSKEYRKLAKTIKRFVKKTNPKVMKKTYKDLLNQKKLHKLAPTFKTKFKRVPAIAVSGATPVAGLGTGAAK